MPQPIVVVDAFTDRPFGGNPAAVCVLEMPRDDAWMGLVAREMNLSETAFLLRLDDGTFSLRWFTPTIEVDLCGHATLAASHALWTESHLAVDEPARFETRSGLLTARRDGDWIELDFPATPAGVRCPGPVDTPADPVSLEAILGAPVVAAAYSKFDLLVELESEAAVRAVAPRIGEIASLPVRGVIVTAASDPGTGFDFVSRFFAPAVGVDEDPVCGSAHCCLAPYWGSKLGKTTLMAYQASARGGVLRLGVVGDRVTLAGRAVTTLRGALVAG